MKAHELRIGNFVNLFKGISDDGAEYEVYELVSFDIYKLDESNCEDVEPIPLTEEWLLKFGFKRDGAEYKNGLWKIAVDYPKKEIIRFGLFSKKLDWTRLNETSFSYVHQLQNLYFALCGEELKF